MPSMATRPRAGAGRSRPATGCSWIWARPPTSAGCASSGTSATPTPISCRPPTMARPGAPSTPPPTARAAPSTCCSRRCARATCAWPRRRARRTGRGHLRIPAAHRGAGAAHRRPGRHGRPGGPLEPWPGPRAGPSAGRLRAGGALPAAAGRGRAAGRLGHDPASVALEGRAASGRWAPLAQEPHAFGASSYLAGDAPRTVSALRLLAHAGTAPSVTRVRVLGPRR